MINNIFNKKFFIFALLVLSASSYSRALKYLEDGVDKTDAIKTQINIDLKDDFARKIARAEENKGLRIVDREGLSSFTDKEYIGRTGIHFDFENKEDEVNPNSEVVKGKTINILNGSIHAEGNTYGYKNSRRIGIIEDSEINITRNKKVAFYNGKDIESFLLPYLRKESSPGTYVELEESDLPKIGEIIKKEKNREGMNLSYSPIDAYNAKIIFKNSRIKIIDDFPKDENFPAAITIENNFSFPNIDNGEEKILKNYSGIEFQRDLASSSIYDLETEGNIDIKTIYTSKGNNLFGKDSVPLLKFGKNTRIKAGILDINLDMNKFFSEAMGPGLTPPENISAGTVDDEIIVFESNSDVNLSGIKGFGANVLFKGGKLTLREGGEFNFKKSIVRGDLVLNSKTVSFENGNNLGFFAKPDTQITDLTLLSGSKVDLNYISHGRAYNNSTEIEKVEEALDSEKGQKFALTFKDDSNFYISQVAEANITLDQNSHLHLYKESDKDTIIMKKNITDWDGWKAAEYYGNIPIHELTFDQKYGSGDHANDVQFREKLTLNNAHIHFRTNLEKQLSDKLIVKNNVLSGDGTTVLHIKNQGGSNTTGKEKVNLIEAKKGIDSTLRFKLNNKVEVGGYEYTLGSSTDGEGRTFFLIGEGLQNLEKEESGIRNNHKDYSFKKNLRKISPIKASKFNIDNDGIEINANKNEYSIHIENADGKIKNSEILIKNGLGAKFEKTPLVIENSYFYIDSKDTNSGLLIKANDSPNTLLTLKREKEHTNAVARDLFVNGRFEVVGNKNTNEVGINIKKNARLEIFNPKGDKALILKNTLMNVENGAELFLEGETAIHSQNSELSGEFLLYSKGSLIHEGDRGINLVLKKGSFVDSPTILFDSSTLGSSLHFKEGSILRLSKLSNANLKMDKGSKLYLYSQEQANELLFDKNLNSTSNILSTLSTSSTGKATPAKKLSNKGNTVVLAGETVFDDIDVYARINLLANTADRIVVDGAKGILKGKGITLHLKNAGDMDVDNVNRKVNFFKGKVEDNFKFNMANELEIGSYVYDTKLERTKDDQGITKLEYILREKTKRKVKLSSTAMGAIENTYSDYFSELTSIDSIFDGLNNFEFSKKNSVWAKTDATSVTTKENFKTVGNSVYVGFDKQIKNIESLHAGIFIGNTQTRKNYDKYSGKGASSIFHGGLYLSYRGFIGEGDVILKYSDGKTDYNVLDTAGDRISNKYDYSSKMIALQFGRKLYPMMNENLYIEPRIQVSYGEIDGISSTATNGLRTKFESIRTWSTGGDLRLGYKKNNFNTFIKAGISKEFLGDIDARFNNRGVESRQVDEAIVTVGAGIEYSIGNHNISLSAEKKESTLLKDYYRASLSYKFKF
ncbi:autotransporter outer membrane beta-barrel domain-containing protein [Fusobacterium russii]|uniref:autotransporter outer membrane beta-barrel domain-containing protein n=1 Tax=Fusobacterium russii TaxID=854 RepID=UPI00039DE692|nr:autotransporter outer membrane beta-barrel domain-containing protein [Fusobacterium russii]